MREIWTKERVIQELAKYIRVQGTQIGVKNLEEIIRQIIEAAYNKSTDVSGKADKVSNATSGNFAALDFEGNLIDSGHKHSDYLTEHQDISGKQDVITDLDTIRSSAAAGATAYQKPVTGIHASDIATGVIPDISGKQDTLVSGTNIKTINNGSILGSGNITIETRYPVNNQSSSSFNATVENYYRFTSNVDTITITLPAPSDSYTHSIFFKFTTGSSPAVTFSSSESIIYYSDFAIEASTTYEVNALYNGTEWIVALATIE